MKKIGFLFFVLLLFSCDSKEVQLPKAEKTIVADVMDHSPVYLFFEIKGKDTLAEVNRKNTIGTTNWIFNIDKRLPLRIVIPQVMKLQEKKKNGMHTSDKAENYYCYVDSKNNKMAFLPFTEVDYKTEKPQSGTIIFFDKNNQIQINGIRIENENLQQKINELGQEQRNTIRLCLDKNMSFETYIQGEILIYSLQIPMNASREQFVY